MASTRIPSGCRRVYTPSPHPLHPIPTPREASNAPALHSPTSSPPTLYRHSCGGRKPSLLNNHLQLRNSSSHSVIPDSRSGIHPHGVGVPFALSRVEEPAPVKAGGRPNGTGRGVQSPLLRWERVRVRVIPSSAPQTSTTDRQAMRYIPGLAYLCFAFKLGCHDGYDSYSDTILGTGDRDCLVFV